MLAGVLIASSTYADTLLVPDEYPTIQAAVDAALDGDEIIVAPGEYTSTADNIVRIEGKRLSIRANGTPEETVLNGEDARRCILISGGATQGTIISGFSIINGRAPEGAGISGTDGTEIEVHDCIITQNRAIKIDGSNFSGVGGGIGSDSTSQCFLRSSIVQGNSAEDVGGGAFFRATGCIVDTSQFFNNQADSGVGAAIYFQAQDVTLLDSVICGNIPSYDQVWGGVLIDKEGTCIADYCLDTNENNVPDQCEGVNVRNVPDDYKTIQAAVDAAAVNDLILIANGTYTGTGNAVIELGEKRLRIQGQAEVIIDGENQRRGLSITDASASGTIINNLTFRNGSSDQQGGGALVENQTDIAFVWCAFSGNRAEQGAGIAMTGTQAAFSYCTIFENTSGSTTGGDGSGAGMLCRNSSVELDYCIFEGNAIVEGGFGGGGGIAAFNSELALRDSEVHRNSISTINGTGGAGLYLEDCSLRVDRSSIYFNDARLDQGSLNGGGLYITGDASQVELYDSEVQDNYVGDPLQRYELYPSGIGGGIWAGEGVLVIDRCRITGNTAVDGGGIATWADTTIANTVLTNLGNSSFDLFGGSIKLGANVEVSGFPNVKIPDDCAFVTPGNIQANIQTIATTTPLEIGNCCVQGMCLPTTSSACAEFKGQWFGTSDCQECEPTCREDLNGDGRVDGSDLTILLGFWGPCP